MPLISCFNLVSPEVAKQLDQMIVVGPFQLKLFYSTLIFFGAHDSGILPCVNFQVVRLNADFDLTI